VGGLLHQFWLLQKTIFWEGAPKTKPDCGEVAAKGCNFLEAKTQAPRPKHQGPPRYPIYLRAPVLDIPQQLVPNFPSTNVSGQLNTIKNQVYCIGAECLKGSHSNSAKGKPRKSCGNTLV
jgi:hypothetical protein